ncbi:MAG: phosphatase PAP2 family protein [Nitriliruptorales bacterium]|nr:phosphatase PAP2 family protein [Nitriliruptorales bacterium]
MSHTGLKRLLLGAALLGGTWAALQRPALQRADVRAGDALRRFGTPALDRAVTGTTDMGSIYGVVGTAAVLAAAGRRDAAEDALAVGATAWALAQTNKRFVRRQRPYEADGVRRLIRPPTGSSFPSGHAAVGVAMLSRLAERGHGGGSQATLTGLGAYVAASRVYVGVHYPSDVFGGAGLGLMISGLWRGPVAAAGRALIRLSLRAARALTGPLRRFSALVLLDFRLRGRASAASAASEERPAA